MVQVEGVWGYDEDQVALVVLDSTGFGSWVPVTLGTPTINCIINVIKEGGNWWAVGFTEWIKDIPIVGLLVSRTLIWKEAVANNTVDPTNLDEVVKTTKKEEVDSFSSKIIHGWMKTLLLGNNMHVMTHSLKGDEGFHLPHGLSVVGTYTEVISGSKQVMVVMKNLTAVPITISKSIKATQVVAVSVVPPVKQPLTLLRNWMRYRVSSRIGWWLDRGRNFSSSSWICLA